jgi:hypothetical protein
MQNQFLHILRYIQNIPDWCRHLYSSCGSVKRREMVRLQCLVSQCAKLHVPGWTWAVFTRVYLESCISISPQPGNFWIHPPTLIVLSNQGIKNVKFPLNSQNQLFLIKTDHHHYIACRVLALVTYFGPNSSLQGFRGVVLGFVSRMVDTVRSESRCALRLRYVDLVVSIDVAVEVCCCFTAFSC